MASTWSARLGAVFAAAALVVAMASAASAEGGGSEGGGGSTPGAVVTAMNPGTSALGGDLKITLTAHSELSTVADPSCRPEDLTLRCWGSLVLRVPELAIVVKGLDVHRVAVGDISCGDDEGGGCGDGDMAATPAGLVGEYPLQAQVNGIAVLTDPGSTGLPAGTQVQVKITLTDNGTEQYGDVVVVQVNQFVPGPTKPQIYLSEPIFVQQVQIHELGAVS